MMPQPISNAVLPPLRGRVEANAPLGPATWFRVGGAADVLVRPADLDDLLLLLRDMPADMPLTILGAASNMIIRDGGIAGVVLRLARGFGDVVVEADGIIAGAAALDVTVAETAAAAGLAGLEWVCCRDDNLRWVIPTCRYFPSSDNHCSDFLNSGDSRLHFTCSGNPATRSNQK